MKKYKIILVVLFWITAFAKLIAQGIDITTGAKIVANGNAKIEVINGNFINNGTYTMGTENFIFSGSSLGNILGSSNNDFYHLTVNNSNGVTDQSTGYIAVNNLLTFSQGLFNTNSNYLIINDNATYTGSNTTKYINGNCRKVGNDAFVFPIGNGGKYAPIAISAPNLITDHFTATYFKTNPNSLYDISLKDTTIDHISTLEYWKLERTNGTSNAIVTLYWDTASAINNLLDLMVVRWDGLKWVEEGNVGTTGNTSLGNISSKEVIDFSPFTFGSVSLSNPLPVELLSFKTECDNRRTIINWVTASETNCDFFKIEKLIKGEKDFKLLTKVNGNGNSQQIINYQFVDDGIVNASYYRLSQVDFNGNETVFNQTITYSKCGEANYSKEVKMYENLGDIYILNNAQEDIPSQIKIFDLNGKTLFNKQVNLIAGLNRFNTDELNLSKGIYLVNLQNQTTNKSIKMIVR